MRCVKPLGRGHDRFSYYVFVASRSSSSAGERSVAASAQWFLGSWGFVRSFMKLGSTWAHRPSKPRRMLASFLTRRGSETQPYS